MGRRVTTGVSEVRAASIFSTYMLQIEAACAPEKLLSIYQTTRQDSRNQLYSKEKLKCSCLDD